LGSTIEDIKEGIDQKTEDIDTLNDGIRSLDKAVKDATERRQEENDYYRKHRAHSSSAIDLLVFAKERLRKFYAKSESFVQVAPVLDEPPLSNLRPELGPGSLGQAPSLVQLASRARRHVPPPPQAASEAYKSKGSSAGVLTLIQILINDVGKEMKAAQVEEHIAQEEYERFMQDSGAKRTADGQSIGDKESARTDLKEEEESVDANRKFATKDLTRSSAFKQQLHTECDWLAKFYDVRKEARKDESDSLTKAEVVLQGVDFDVALVQTEVAHTRGRSRFLATSEPGRHGPRNVA